MILDNEDILMQKTEKSINIPNIAYEMLRDVTSSTDRDYYAKILFEYIKSHYNLSDHISYVINSSFFSLHTEKSNIYLFMIYPHEDGLRFLFYYDYHDNLKHQLKSYELTTEQYDLIINKLIELFDLEVYYEYYEDIDDDIDDIDNWAINNHGDKHYISQYDFR